ncbi:NADH-quinone oxidoreductase subunit L [Candidatus Sumerlaeota bacterium]|nr:NADH-quinone oxidoreductase subunit L [Candidatus Sumerlaeota bacterium]
MLHLLWLIPSLPLAGFLVLALAGRRLPRALVSIVGVGSVGLSALLSLLIAREFVVRAPEGDAFVQTLWVWMNVGGFAPSIGFRLDALSLLMTLVVTCVGFLIHLYSTEYMRDDEGFSRFFAYMNLFVAMMLALVLADNLVLLYLGWEGVGLCSYLLIGFWSRDPANDAAARKAFIVTRVGDAAMAIGLFILFTQLGTLDIQDLMQRAVREWPVGSGVAVAAAALLLGGAVGKSAQLPLQTWLPDAMAGPTPVSALIHAATMVTAGVYLIARTNVLFTLAPSVQALVMVVGALTLLLAGCSALVQTDIKRVLAYSTISQIGYMFLALGIGAWQAAMFHFMTHAFFKALLFLAAGAVIVSLHHEQDMFKMGGLRKQLPTTFWTFLIGAAALSALPLVTAGYYSKDAILHHAWSLGRAGLVPWTAGVLGAFLTGLYTFRMVFLVFFGEAKTKARHGPGFAIHLPLVLLGALSIFGGFVETPESLGHVTVFGRFVGTILPEAGTAHAALGPEWLFHAAAVGLPLLGIALACWFYLLRPRTETAGLGLDSLRRFWFSGWGFDWVYDLLFVKPFVTIARLNRSDAVDWFYRVVADLSVGLHLVLRLTQSGRLRRYASGIALGAAIILAIVELR